MKGGDSGVNRTCGHGSHVLLLCCPCSVISTVKRKKNNHCQLCLWRLSVVQTENRAGVSEETYHGCRVRLTFCSSFYKQVHGFYLTQITKCIISSRQEKLRISTTLDLKMIYRRLKIIVWIWKKLSKRKLNWVYGSPQGCLFQHEIFLLFNLFFCLVEPWPEVNLLTLSTSSYTSDVSL